MLINSKSTNVAQLTWCDINVENRVVDVEHKEDTDQTWPWLIKDSLWLNSGLEA